MYLILIQTSSGFNLSVRGSQYQECAVLLQQGQRVTKYSEHIGLIKISSAHVLLFCSSKFPEFLYTPCKLIKLCHIPLWCFSTLYLIIIAIKILKADKTKPFEGKN